MDEKIVKVLNEMSEFLSIAQMKKLQEVILKTFAENEAEHSNISNDEFLDMFLAAKRVEGCSDRTIQYYRVTIEHMFTQIETAVRKITTEEIRVYLAEYQKRNNCSNVTIDNVRRNISSFFSWLEEEDYILKSPTKRIHKIKTKKVVKNTISDEGIEKLRDNCREIRDLAIIDLLYSTGIRVGELVNLNIDDIDLEGRECVVYGKGDKERRVYFDAKAKVHLKKYIDTRKDNNVAFLKVPLRLSSLLPLSNQHLQAWNRCKASSFYTLTNPVVTKDLIFLFSYKHTCSKIKACWQGSYIWWRGDESYREYILAAFDGDSDGDCRCSLGMYPVHYDYWYSIRKAIFQAREIVADAIWGNGCIGRGNRSCKYL